MDQVSRPVQVLLAVTVLFAALWFVALRPKSSSGGEPAAAPASAPATPAPTSGAAPGSAGLARAVEKAQGAVATANGQTQQAAPSRATAVTPSRTGGAKAPAGHAASVPAARPTGSPQVRAVKTALRRHEAVAIAFVDPRTADARAVAQEIAHVSHFGGRAATFAAPLAKLSAYPFITSSVQVTVAPTVVIVDPHRKATTIVGFADRGEIEQRLADALAVKRR